MNPPTTGDHKVGPARIKLVRLVMNNKIHKFISSCHSGTIIKRQIPTELGGAVPLKKKKKTKP